MTVRYARVLVARWSRREWLTVLVVAVTAAFLMGTALLLLTAGGYAATLEGDLAGSATVAHYDSVTAARAAAPADGVVVPTATVTDRDGETRRVVGVPADAPRVVAGASVDWQEARLPDPPAEGLAGPAKRSGRQRLHGSAETIDVRVHPHADEASLFPPWWYVGPPETVDQLGATGAFVVDPGDSDGATTPAERRGTPLIGALPFLLAGIDQVIRTLSIAAASGGVLVLVVVYSVTRMAIRDRARTIRVVRATGESPVRLFGVLVSRAALLSVAGVSLGYAVGVIATKAVVNLAVYAGLPVSLDAAVTPAVAGTLAALGALLVGAGAVAGAVAAVPAIRTRPADLRGSVRSGRSPGDGGSRLPAGRLREVATPTLLAPRVVVPTAATLTVFVLIVLLVGSLWGAFAPLAATSEGTIVENGAAHPLNSRINPDYAALLRSEGIAASPEIVYAQVSDGRPYLVRGADFDAFANVSAVEVVRGRPPDGPDEAAIGSDLARTLGVETGDAITLGGSVTPGVRRVTVVGVYEASGALDDQLVVPRRTVAGLATNGDVHLIRTEGVSAAEFDRLTSPPRSGISVGGVAAPDAVTSGETFEVRLSVRNFEGTPESADVPVRIGNRTIERSVELGPNESAIVGVEVDATRIGTHEVAAGEYAATVTVYDPHSFRFPPEFPDRAPPGAALLVPAMTPNESLVADATVALDGETVETDERGVAPVSVPEEPGTYEVVVRKEGFEPASHELRVERGAPRRIGARLAVAPEEGSPLTRPTVRLRAANPWGDTLARNLTLVSPAGRETRSVRFTPGNVTETTIDPGAVGFEGRTPPGTYDLRLRDDSTGETIAAATYRVRGDRRALAAAAGEGSYARGTGIGRTIEDVFGNVQLLFAAMIALAGLSTVGGTTAAFAQAVHARRRTVGIYRATGATARRVVTVLLADVLRLAIPSTAVAFAIAGGTLWALRVADLLVVFGVRLTVPDAWLLLTWTAVGALVLSAVSAVLGASASLRASPADLLRPEE